MFRHCHIFFWPRQIKTRGAGAGEQGPEDGPMDLCRVQLDRLRARGFAGASSAATLGVPQESGPWWPIRAIRDVLCGRLTYGKSPCLMGTSTNKSFKEPFSVANGEFTGGYR